MGSELIYSTYLGGTGWDQGKAIAVDMQNDAYITGEARSSNFPITPGAFNNTVAGAFLTRLSATGSSLVYSTYLGSGAGSAIAVDSSGDAYIAGQAGGNFPTTPGAFIPTNPAPHSMVGFIAKLIPLPSPATTGRLTGTLGNNGWYLGPVTITLTATDPNSPVSATYFNLDGVGYQLYGLPLTVTSNGAHQILYFSVDNAVREETPHGQGFQIDAMKPSSHVNALPATAASPNFKVQWSGTDATSGLLDYTIFVSDNSGPFNPWLVHTTATQAWYAGSLGHTYKFYNSARDVAGNVEVKTTPDATTFVPQMPGDANGDGQINCLDLAIVKASMGKSTGQPGFDPRADVNHDGIVNVLDLAIVSQKLIPGTICP
jgi:hypothetical protein